MARLGFEDELDDDDDDDEEIELTCDAGWYSELPRYTPSRCDDVVTTAAVASEFEEEEDAA